MTHIVLKLGGTALSNGAAFERAAKMVRLNERYTIVVPSAPADKDWRVTELLRRLERSDERWAVYSTLEDRLLSIVRALPLNSGAEDWISKEIMQLSQYIDSDQVDWNVVISKGEFWSATILSRLLKIPFVDPTSLIKFKRNGEFSECDTKRAFKEAELPERFVMPGFYGSDSSGTVHLFPRNGSDISAALVAAETNASELHIARKGAAGIYAMNPGIYDGSPTTLRVIDCMSHAHAREMTYRSDSGALHPLALVPISRAGTIVRIFDVERPEKPGTYIVPEGHPMLPVRRGVLGIAERPGFTVFTLKAAGLNERRNVMRRVAKVLGDFGLGYEHEATGVDHVSISIRNDALRSRQNEVARSLRRNCKVSVSFRQNEGSICLVGQNLGSSLIDIGYLLMALGTHCGNAHEPPGTEIRLSLMSMSDAGTSIVLGVQGEALRKAVNRLYKEVIRKR